MLKLKNTLYKKVQKKVYQILEISQGNELFNRPLDIFIISLILLNVGVTILETIESRFHGYTVFFETFEIFSVTVFTVEYLLHLWVCTIDKKFSCATGRLRFAVTPLAVIDLVAILPFYVHIALPVDLHVMRMLYRFRTFRILRLLRLLKLIRYSKPLRVFAQSGVGEK